MTDFKVNKKQTKIYSARKNLTVFSALTVVSLLPCVQAVGLVTSFLRNIIF